ncbi:MAG: Ig-like domain-containing protein, partial [Candidatus Thorarchaeota archaeon]|nr:Ig-like domain-containing protein [Candidatus Thorarchaeota archaeon]
MYSDILSVDPNIDPSAQTVDIVYLHVGSNANVIFGQYCTCYFDDLYLGSTPPEISINHPDDDQYIAGTYTFQGSAIDNRGQGLSSVQYWLHYDLPGEHTTWENANGLADWSVTVDTNLLDDGLTDFYARVTDATGTRRQTMVSFYVDNTAPSLIVSSPSASAYVKGSVSISGTASDAGCGLNNVQVKIDSGQYTPTTGTTSWSYSWDTTAVTDGSHTIYVKAVDDLGNEVVKSVTVTVDNTGPVVGTITFAPRYGSQGTEFDVSIDSVTDAGIGVKSVTATIEKPDGTTFTLTLARSNTGTLWSSSFTLNSQDLQGDYNLLNVKASDFFDHTTTATTTKIVTYDRTKPVLTL